MLVWHRRDWGVERQLCRSYRRVAPGVGSDALVVAGEVGCRVHVCPSHVSTTGLGPWVPIDIYTRELDGVTANREQ